MAFWLNNASSTSSLQEIRFLCSWIRSNQWISTTRWRESLYIHFLKGKPFKGMYFEAKNLIFEYFSLEYSCGAQTQDSPGTATLYSVHGGGSLLVQYTLMTSMAWCNIRILSTFILGSTNSMATNPAYFTGPMTGRSTSFASRLGGHSGSKGKIN